MNLIDGPALHHDERPWPIMWEGSVDESCAHIWERCLLLADGPRRWRSESVARCAKCHVPRCGNVGDEDPCIERRHHDSLHIYLSGRFEPLGGILA